MAANPMYTAVLLRARQSARTRHSVRVQTLDIGARTDTERVAAERLRVHMHRSVGKQRSMITLRQA